MYPILSYVILDFIDLSETKPDPASSTKRTTAGVMSRLTKGFSARGELNKT